jgi:hypothetical protein
MEFISGNITEISEIITGNLREVVECISGNVTEGATIYTRRHKWLSPYSYNGKAAAGSLESDAVWKIVRIEIAGDGSVVEIKTLNNVKWSDVLTLIF